MSDSVTGEQLHAHNRYSIRWASHFIVGGLLVLVIVIALSLSLWFRQNLLEAYNIEQAGRLMDVGLAWPEPHVLDSMPVSQNAPALEQALGHLAAAIRWQPDSVQAYRLAGRIYAAQQSWPQAAEALEKAQALDKHNALLAWERALIYEQIWWQLRADPGETLVPALEQAVLMAPSTLLDTPFCRDGRPETCYSTRTSFTQPLASMPEGPEVSADAIFLHPPAELRLTQKIPQAHSTLFFLMGMDPRAREWGSDGAGFQVLVQFGDAPVTQVYDITLDAEASRRGWTPATVDLAQWAGKSVTLILRTTAGPAFNTSADWFSWGNVTLLSAEQAQLALLSPEARTRAAWAMSGIDGATFRSRAEEALRHNQYAAAFSWNERERIINNQDLPGSAFLATVATLMSGATEPSKVNVPPEFVHQIVGVTRIEAETLRWTTTGEPLFAGTDLSARALLTVGDAIAMVHITQPGLYRITTRVQHTPPAPVTFQIENDFKRLGQFSMQRGDMSWQNVLVETELAIGTHLVGVRFLNDAQVGGIDRNLVVDWLQIELVK